MRSVSIAKIRASLAVCVVAGLGLPACGPTELSFETGLRGLSLDALAPSTVVPGSRLEIEGSSLIDPPGGNLMLRVQGEIGSSPVDAALPIVFRDFGRAHVDIDDQALTAFGRTHGTLVGEAWIEAESAISDELYASERSAIQLDIRESLTPNLESVGPDGVVFVNDEISARGRGLLLGGEEGDTVAVIDGCFRPSGEASCEPVTPAEVPIEPYERTSRDRGYFPLSPEIAGIEPGAFEGQITLENRHRDGEVVTGGEARSLDVRIARPAISRLSPGAASLGQYVFVRGGGFVGEGDGTTVLELQGTFEPDGGGEAVDLSFSLIPEQGSGRTVRYVVSEDDSLGGHPDIDLRSDTGLIIGELTPRTRHEGTEVRGDPHPFELEVAPVKQVVKIRFLDSYRRSLRRFGMKAVDAQVRARVTDVVRRDYDTINLEVRREPVDDFALHAIAEISGPDPNGLGLLGYDNTPGKDVGNQRLHDRIGGVNALTQQDGFPGYGGVFIESFLLLGEEGGSSLSDPLFDEIFDPFRPARGGEPISGEDLAGGIPILSSGDDCPAPASDRELQVACAIWVLGSLIGTTLSHEIGHSLGLANPYGDGFHNQGDAPNRLMDAGQNRPFAERAELEGKGPGRFCVDAYEYLRDILPTDEPMDLDGRPAC